jgi:hypothetical protein
MVIILSTVIRAVLECSWLSGWWPVIARSPSSVHVTMTEERAFAN